MLEAQSRTIVQNLTPQIDGGRHFIKRVVGQTIVVEVDLFGDGHDVINGQLLFKHEKQKKWQEVYLTEMGNDRWQARFKVDKIGYYQYTVKGWIDRALTWQHELQRKVTGGLAVSVELKDGQIHLKALMAKANAKEKAYLQSLSKLLGQKRSYQTALKEALSEKLKKLFLKYPVAHFSITHEPLSVFVDRTKALFSTWYEFFPRSTAAIPNTHGSFKDAEKILPRLAEMGFDTVYFPPVHPIGKHFRKGKDNQTKAAKNDPGSPWGIGAREGGHKSLHAELGNLKDFKQLIKTAQKNGLEVAMDFALQCSPDHHYVKEHPQWFKWRSDGSVQYAENPPKKYQDILPLHFETEDWENLWHEMLSILLYWIEQGVYIFRVDNPHTKPYRFWQWIIAQVKQQYPEVLFLAEAFTRPKVMHQLAKVGFTQSYTYFTWRNDKKELTSYLEELTQTSAKEYFRPNFWPNTPDINPYILQNGHEPLFLIRHFLAATLSSNYGIYGPVFEYMNHDAVPGKEEYHNSEKYEIRHWDWKHTNKLTWIISIINRLRKENAALQQTNNLKFCAIENEYILCYFKYDDDHQNHLLMTVNLDPYYKQSGWVQLPLSLLQAAEGQVFMAHDLISGNAYRWEKEWNFVELDPHVLPFHLFLVKKD